MVSTGIGTDNIDIVVNELDALVNIDFETRTIKPAIQSLKLIRLGTSGALQEDIAVDSFVAGTHGLGFDNVMHFYQCQNNEAELALLEAFKKHTSLTTGNVLPYLFEGSNSLLQIFKQNYTHGITIGCPGFFGPQGRVLRLSLAYPGLIDRLSHFKHNEHFVSNFEMESSAIYGLCRLLGHEALSLNVIVANRVRQEFSTDGNKAVEALIKLSLDILATSDI